MWFSETGYDGFLITVDSTRSCTRPIVRTARYSCDFGGNWTRRNSRGDLTCIMTTQTTFGGTKSRQITPSPLILLKYFQRLSLSSSPSSANCHSLANSSIYLSFALSTSIPRILPKSSHALSRDRHIPAAPGSFSRFIYFRCVSNNKALNTLISYCSVLLGQHGCHCSCQCQVSLDTGYRK